MAKVTAEEKYFVKTSFQLNDYPKDGIVSTFKVDTEVPEELLKRKDLHQYFYTKLVKCDGKPNAEKTIAELQDKIAILEEALKKVGVKTANKSTADADTKAKKKADAKAKAEAKAKAGK